MAAVRLSPGVYQVNGKTVRAATAAQAEQMAGGGQAPAVNNSQKSGNKQGGIPNTINNVNQGINANRTASINDARTNINFNNPNVNNPLGTQNITYDANGNPTINQNLSQNQQGILTGQEGLTKLGTSLANDNLTGIAGGPQYRDAINYDPKQVEDAVYNSLTRGVQQKNDTAMNNLAQQLYNKGLQPGTQAYDDQYKLLKESQDTFDLNARNQATMSGLQAQNQYFNQNETQTANDMNKYNNTINSSGALANLGSGLLMPNFSPYQGATVNSGTPTDINYSLGQLKQGNRQLNIAQQAANRSGGGGGGGGSQMTPEQQDAAARRAAGFA